MAIKVLEISTVGLMYDGITSIMLSYLDAMDKEGLDIYVASTIRLEPEIYKRLKKMGCHVVQFSSRKTDTIKYMYQLIKFIHKNKIDVVHAHGNSGTLAIEMICSWLGGSKKRIAHSHNTKCNQVKADKLLRPVFNLFYTDGVACGEAAGKWLFGNRPFLILKNGRDLEKFSYNPIIRDKMRKKYQLDNEIIIGHVGSFLEQKNHKFLIKVFREILNINDNAKLFLIGSGPLEKEIKDETKDIKNNVEFIGNTNCVEKYLQIMDGMLLPSLFEGLPLVSIEWQIAGLPCLMSDSITRECRITEQVEYMSLQEEPQLWANKILEMIKENTNRVQICNVNKEKIKKAGFDIKDNAKVLKQLYLGTIN